jgi:hypothetical protein
MTLALAAPLKSGRASIPKELLGFPVVGLGVAITATCPDGVPVAPEPAETKLLRFTAVPWLIPLIELTTFPLTLALSVVADGEKLTDDQLLTRFCALTEPSPVAMS